MTMPISLLDRIKATEKRIFLYGVPGVGKTYFSKLIGENFGLFVIEGDFIRNRVKRGKSKSEFPFLHLGTCKAYREFGELNKKNALRGLISVRKALLFGVMEEIKKHQEFVFEGAFLDPEKLMQYGKVILLISSDVKRHKRQFLSHREKLLDFQENEFKVARLLQDFLVAEAKNLNIEVIDNSL